MLKLDKKVYDKCNRAVLITGCARSGTTILGKIIHSFENVEYSFEPPTLISLINKINEIDKASWKLMYETYLYEEFLINALAGRNLNFNANDDSSIYNVKSTQEIEKRLSKSWRKTESERNAEISTIAYKIPNILPFVEDLQKIYYDTKVIVVIRPSKEIINSLYNKHWFSDKSLKTTNALWPNIIHNEIRIPYWVRKSDQKKWRKMKEIDRCAYYVIRQYKYLNMINNYIKVDYHKLLSSPLREASHLAMDLGLTFGPKTQEIINTVQPQGTKIETAIIETISKDFTQQLERLEV